MVLINSNLPQKCEDVKANNTTSSYLPVNTNGKNEFDWERVSAGVLRVIKKKKIEGLPLEKLAADSKQRFFERQDDKRLWPIIEKMYFHNDQLFKISLEFLLFKAQDRLVSSLEKRIVRMFASMLQKDMASSFTSKVNFLEKPMLDVVNSHMVDDKSLHSEEEAYLPFLEKALTADIQFLLERPKYLLSNFTSALEFYAFSYIAQLSLSITEWHTKSAPEAKPLYFILEHERASSEREHLKNHGFKLLKECLPRLFPMLSMLELIQAKQKDNSDEKRLPLWAFAAKLESYGTEADLQRLKDFTIAFKEQRELRHFLTTDFCVDKVLADIFELAVEQFSKSAKGERHSANSKVVSSIYEMFSKSFVQSRGAYGNALVLKQDMLILLTNLTIGNQERLRLHELIKGFEQRGVFLDKQTEQDLIGFYERIGNVERMSDSGDAVYVRKTV